jgi:cytochrome P450
MKDVLGKPISARALFDDAFKADPYPYYRTLRSEAPVMWDEVLQAWVVTRAEDIGTILHDADDFSSNRVGIGRQRFPDPEFGRLFDLIELLMLQSDGPSHDRMRRLTAQAFKRHAIEAYAPAIRRQVETLFKAHAGSGSMEFVHEFASPLPVLIISEILGIPADDQTQIKEWCDAFSIVALNFYSRITDDQLRAGRDAVEAFTDYLKIHLAESRGRGGTDLISVLVDAEEHGDQLTFDELVANVILLLNAGNETTTVLLTNAAYVLCTRPDLQTGLRKDPDGIPQFIEETLRYYPPVQFIGRQVARDIVLGGETLRAGDLVMIFLGAAGRDAASVDSPEEFRLDRARSPHLSFGTGPHVCLGLQLARLEARVAIETLLSRYASVRLGGDGLDFGPNLNLRSYARLPLEYSV